VEENIKKMGIEGDLSPKHIDKLKSSYEKKMKKNVVEM